MATVRVGSARIDERGKAELEELLEGSKERKEVW